MPTPNDDHSQIDITQALALLGDSWADASPGEIIRAAIKEIERLRDQIAELQTSSPHRGEDRGGGRSHR